MLKFKLVTLSVMLGLGALMMTACGGDKPEVKTAEAEVEAETVQTVKRYWQLNATDPNVPADQRLYCWYTVVERTPTGAQFAQAEVNTSGQCDWAQLETQAGAPAKKLPGENLKAIDTVISGVDFPEGSGSKWDCAALEVTTNMRTFTTYDCNLALPRERPAGFAAAVEPVPSRTPEEAAWRLNQLLYMK